jgi:hypothetical protein
MAGVMTHKKAVKVALESMRREMRVYAFDAALCRDFGSHNATAENALVRHTELETAIKTLKQNPVMIEEL